MFVTQHDGENLDELLMRLRREKEEVSKRLQAFLDDTMRRLNAVGSGQTSSVVSDEA